LDVKKTGIEIIIIVFPGQSICPKKSRPAPFKKIQTRILGLDIDLKFQIVARSVTVEFAPASGVSTVRWARVTGDA
jgi:hypothetical protein